MNHAILKACLPCFIAFLIGCVLLFVVMRLSGARWNWQRLRRLHQCQHGGVQSLSFVVTLPLFVMIMLFIVQMSQMMIGITMVHYAAFAAARAASVWIPAEVMESPMPEAENKLNLMNYVEAEGGARIFGVLTDQDSYKFRRIRTAAVLACSTIAPSRDLGLSPQTSIAQETLSSVLAFYGLMAPGAGSNSRIAPRLSNKLAYSDMNTKVVLEWREASNSSGRNTLVSPTYNPRNHPNPAVIWDPTEVGWQDAITVYVVHRYALLPGPGRFLARQLIQPSGLPDRVSQRISTNQGTYSETVYTTELSASATMTNEGTKSVRPYLHQVL